MANLMKIDKEGIETNINEVEVHPEEKIEEILHNQKVLPDIKILQRQMQSYTSEDRIDLIGIDSENNIVIIEVKDGEVTENVIPQVMRYAFWIETHPDAIKSRWLESDLSEDSKFDWEKKLNIKILIIGPSFKSSVRKLINKINYDIELIEFKKFEEGKDSYIFLNNLPIEKEKISKIKYAGDYDEAFYKTERNPNSVDIFLKVADKLEQYAKLREWNLNRSNNKSYISFKHGFPIVFGINFIGSKSMCLFFKIPKEKAESIKIEGTQMYKYEDEWTQVLYKVESADIDLEKFKPLFDASYEYITNKKK